MTEAEDIAGRIKNLASQMRGTLRFWGQWFGRPYDNCHQLAECEAAGDVLRLTFDEGETLCVWSPRGAGLDAAARHASCISNEAACCGLAHRQRYFSDCRGVI